MSETTNALIVVGMHRTGTSLTMGALEAMGIDSGSDLLPPGPDNETGYWEDKSILGLNDRLLGVLGKSWSSVAPIAKTDWAKTEVAGLRREAVILLKDHFSESKSWGFKDPRSLRVLPFWQDVLKEIGAKTKYVVTFRNPESVAASLAYRDHFPRSKSYFLWLSYYLPFLDRLVQEKHFFVDYDGFVDNPKDTVDKLFRFVSGEKRSKSKRRLEDIDAFLTETFSQNLRHAQFDAGEIDAGAPAILKETYLLLGKLTGRIDDDEAMRKVRSLQRRYKNYGMLLQQTDDCEAEAGRLQQKVGEEEPVRDKIEKMGLYQADINIKMEQIDTRHKQQAQQSEALGEGLKALADKADSLGDRIERVQTGQQTEAQQNGLLAQNLDILSRRMDLLDKGLEDRVGQLLSRQETDTSKSEATLRLLTAFAERMDALDKGLSLQTRALGAMEGKVEEIQKGMGEQALEWHRGLVAQTMTLGTLEGRVEDIQEKVVVQADEWHRNLTAQTQTLNTLEAVQGKVLAQADEWYRSFAAQTQTLDMLEGRVEDIQEKVVVQIDELHRAIAGGTARSDLSRVDELSLQLADAYAEIELIHRSTSWRLTKPVRAVKLLARKIVSVFRR